LSIEGGFGLDTTNTSNVLLSQAFATILSQILAIPAIISRMGALHSYRMILVLLCFTFVLTPFSAKLPTWAGMPAILLALWIYALGNGLATTASAILYAPSQALKPMQKTAKGLLQNHKHGTVNSPLSQD
jgi:hypothetical protein